MYDFLCLFCQTKHHIKILTAVTFAAKQTYFFQQGLLKHGKMANVIIRPQIVNGKIWLKMGNREFEVAEKTIREGISSLNCPEADIFIEEFIPSFYLSLDEQKEIQP